ncbi:MAG: LPS export ABC transporter periplasmic protein LptC [Pelagibacteraceae bacterium]|nr:LPS export ABC transporter periplasmic protein LptC [Pelagibacteraceae bacterium]
MKSKKKINIILFFGFFFSFIFYTYYISKNKGSINIEDKSSVTELQNSNFQKGVTKFLDVEYKSLDDKGRIYTTTGKEAYLDSKEPNIIILNKVLSYTDLNDGTTLRVVSDKASYYKNSKNIKYYQNVMITNKDAKITADEASFLSNQNLIKLEKKVIFQDSKNIIKSDIAELNTSTNNLKILMKKQKDKVYGQKTR